MDERIKGIHIINGEFSSVLNAGFDVANGDLVVFVKSDDWIYKAIPLSRTNLIW